MTIKVSETLFSYRIIFNYLKIIDILGVAGSDLFAPADGDYLEPVENDNDDDNGHAGFPDDVSDPCAPSGVPYRGILT